MTERNRMTSGLVGPTTVVFCAFLSCTVACSDRVGVEHDERDRTTGSDAGGHDSHEHSGGDNQTDAAVAPASAVSTGSDAAPTTGVSPDPTNDESIASNGSDGTTDSDGGPAPDESGFVPEEVFLATLPVVEPDPIDLNVGTDIPSIAVALARFIWRDAPDATTVDLARRDKLTLPSDVYAEAQRLLADPRSERGFTSFFGAWAEVTRTEGLNSSSSDSPTAQDAGPEATSQYVTALNTELYDFALDVVASDGKFSDLLLSSFDLEQELLLDAFDGEPDIGRNGMLSQPLLLAAGSYSDRTSPSKRGAFIARRLLCRDLTPKDHTLHDAVPTGKTVREWIVGETDREECKDCHSVIDALGFAFEGFDQLGKARVEDGGQAVDTESSLIALGLGEVQDPRGLALELLAHKDVMPCFLSHWFSYALQRQLAAGDLQSWVMLQRGAEFYSLREIPALIASSDAFRAQAAD